VTFREFAWHYFRQYPKYTLTPYFFALVPWLLCVSLLFAVTESPTTGFYVGQATVFFILLIIGTINSVNDIHRKYVAFREWSRKPIKEK
jgi:hypothetical protein